MTITIDIKTTPFGVAPDAFNSVILNLAEKGYSPLISQAKQRFLEALGETDQEKPELGAVRPEELSSAYYEYATGRRHITRYREGFLIPIAGDLFFSTTANGILYVALVIPSSAARKRLEKTLTELCLEVGYVGEESDAECLDTLIASITKLLSDLDVSVDWSPSRPSSPQFLELAHSEDTRFLSATDLSEDELELAGHLEDASARSLALVVKRSGGILATDLVKKGGTNPEEVQSTIEHLTEVGLLAQEYVVICRKTSNQINRVSSREAIEKMTELGVLCSCGRPISEERVEELFSPTPQLQRMLDQSYWMTAKLVQVLTQLNIPQDRILLNLLESAEEIDAFVDLDGTLLMFELKDGEFSMGHAYPFSGRIGLYKPDFAIIVSTKKIAPEVKEYFERVEPGAEIIYVDQLDELASTLKQSARRIRSMRVLQILSRFDPMATVEMPLSQVLASKIGIESEPTRRRGRSLF